MSIHQYVMNLGTSTPQIDLRVTRPISALRSAHGRLGQLAADLSYCVANNIPRRQRHQAKEGLCLDIVVRQDADCGAIEVVILAALERPHESKQSDQAKQQGHRDEIDQDVHRTLSTASCSKRLCAKHTFKAAIRGYGGRDSTIRIKTVHLLERFSR